MPVDLLHIEQLADRAPVDPNDGRVTWARRHGEALRALAQALQIRALPPLGSVAYSDIGALADRELSASTRLVGQVDAVAAWARSYGTPLLVSVPAADDQRWRRTVHTTVPLGGHVTLHVWTVVRLPTGDLLIDQAVGDALDVELTRPLRVIR